MKIDKDVLKVLNELYTFKDVELIQTNAYNEFISQDRVKELLNSKKLNSFTDLRAHCILLYAKSKSILKAINSVIIPVCKRLGLDSHKGDISISNKDQELAKWHKLKEEKLTEADQLQQEIQLEISKFNSSLVSPKTSNMLIPQEAIDEVLKAWKQTHLICTSLENCYPLSKDFAELPDVINLQNGISFEFPDYANLLSLSLFGTNLTLDAETAKKYTLLQPLYDCIINVLPPILKSVGGRVWYVTVGHNFFTAKAYLNIHIKY